MSDISQVEVSRPSWAEDDGPRQLLLGLLAVRAGLLDGDQYTAACASWAPRKEPSLTDVLVQQGRLTSSDVALLFLLLERHLERQDGSIEDTLTAVAGTEAGSLFAGVTDPDLRRFLDDLDLSPSPTSVEDVTPLPPPLLGRDIPALLDTLLPSGGGRPRYTPTKLYATGGMGQVWLARDAALDRDVAFKELRPELVENPQVWRRFLTEARVTGQLEHPGIVPVYELGRRPDGDRPFYTMRFVKGRTLSEAIQAYHAKRKEGKTDPLERRALLDAFVAVCQAVAYAHARGVVHRDLKGQNVVLGDFGEVIVLDWGMARVLAEAGADRETLPGVPGPAAGQGHTEAGTVLGTPAYMSPEQAAGRTDLIGRGTDVYGLGAILYEVLTGRPPFRAAEATELLRQVREDLPEPPRECCRGVPRALEAVCLKSLEKRPENRYPSAAELAREVQRWLADEPVTVYRESVPERLGRWARRHRPLVAGVAALLVTAVLGLSIGTVLIAREQERTRQAALRAQTNFRKALDTVNQYCLRVSEERLLNEPGLQGLRRELLQRARGFYEELLTDPGADPDVEADLARACLRLADLTAAVEPGPQAGEYYQEALDRFGRLVREHPEVSRYQADLAVVHNDLGNWHRNQGQKDAAATEYGEALRLRKELVEKEPEVDEWRRDRARSHNNLAVFHRDAGDLPEALTASMEALILRGELAQAHPEVLDYQLDLAQSENNLAAVLRASKQKFGLVEEAYARCLAILTTLPPDNLAVQEALGGAYNNLGELYRQNNQPSEAEKAFARALPVLEALTKKNPLVTSYQRDLARCLNNLGALYADSSRRARADAAYRQAIDILERLDRDYGPGLNLAEELGMTYLNLAHLLGKYNTLPESVEWYGKAVGRLGPLYDKGQAGAEARRRLRDAHVERAVVLAQLGRHAESVQDWDRMVELDKGQSPKELLLARVAALARKGDYTRAVAEAEALAVGASGGDLYDLACVYALASAAVRKDKGLSAEEQKGRAEQQAARAVELLKESHAEGFLEGALNWGHMVSDPDLEAIRKHPAYKQFLDKARPKGGK
jgi:tetratricopeptide (TPR) repeat protein